jgi:HSP20 family molecular chaperone IbpA
MASDKFSEFDGFSSNLKKILERMMSEFEKANPKGNWDINEIDRNGAKEYIIRGRSGPYQPLDPLDPMNPFEPLDPMNPRPKPQRPFKVPEIAMQETSEPLTDVFDDEETIRLYFEMRGEAKNDIQLNVTGGKVEVKAKNFDKTINLPTSNIDIEKASSKYKNGVLEVIIPKKEKTPESDTHKINID